MNKNELRKQYRQKADELSAGERAELSERIAANFFDALDLSRVLNLHCFIPIIKFNEVDTAFIFRRIWAEFPTVTTLASRSDLAAGTMLHLPYAADSQLEVNAWGISEPKDGEGVAASEIDLVIIPLLCFDTVGNRVGYGKGFYDRFLKQCGPDCVKAGLCYFPPVDRIADVHAGDVALDICVTPDEVFRWG